MPDRPRDHEREEALGMNRQIDRREFINGILIGAGAITASGWLVACTPDGGTAEATATAAVTGSTSPGGTAAYPPALTGLRGSMQSTASVMHALRDGGTWDASGSPTELDEHYDLVVIGAGISGLAAAYYYQQEHGKDARILIVDPHDDFGGHARRTEFTTSSGRKLIGHGGSQALDGPGSFSPLVLDTLEAIGVEYEKFYRYYDQDLYEGMGTAIYFDEDAWGTSHLTMKDKDAAKMFKDAPMAEAAKRDLATLMDSPPDYFPDLSDEEKKAALLDLSYLDFLTEHAKVHPDVVKYLFNVSSGWWSTGIDLFGCLEAWIAGYPGFKGMGLKWTAEPPHGVTATNVSYWDYWLSGDIEPYIFHFPDGNHGVARAFVRQLIPEALAGSTMPDLVTEQLHYDQLDVDGHSTRIRLNSTAVHVEHDGSPDSAEQVRVAYSRNGTLEQVTAGAVIFACWHAAIPYIAADLPSEQKEALGQSFKLTNIYGNVVLRNWKPFKEQGIYLTMMPGSKKWHGFYPDFPVSMGSYEFPSDPNEPMIVQFWADPSADEPASTPKEGAAAARARMWDTTFADYELWMREALVGALGDGGFDPATDIEAITISRWPHGYAYEYMRPNDAFWPDGPTPTEVASAPFGRYAFANSDRAPRAWVHVAIEQAHRAVQELNAVV